MKLQYVAWTILVIASQRVTQYNVILNVHIEQTVNKIQETSRKRFRIPRKSWRNVSLFIVNMWTILVEVDQ